MQTPQDIHSTGNLAFNEGYIGHIGDNHYQIYRVTEEQFSEPTLDCFAEGEWVQPVQAIELVQRLREQRLILIGGDLEDKMDCAYHLAFLLRETLKAEGLPVRVREKGRGKEPQGFETLLEEDGEIETILLLLEIAPRQLVTYAGLSRLRNLLRNKGGYAILTTECRRAEWEVEGGLDAYAWCELSWETYYGRELLDNFLKVQFAGFDTPEGFFPEIGDEDLLIEGMPLAVVVDNLRAPRRIRQFAQSWRGRKGPVDLDRVRSEMDLLQADPQAIQRWYRQFGPEEQLLILGLILFEGLPDDLLFEALERLVETTWRSSDPNLRQFDYQDLPRFSAYFQKVDQGEGRFRVQCNARELRKEILQVAWILQRRRLLAALPVLTGLIRSSVTEPEAPPEPGARNLEMGAVPAVNPSEDQPDRLRLSRGAALQLHDTLVESLSRIGLLSVEVVKPHFLDLVTDPSESVRQFAARALSSWRSEGHDAQLFALLDDWWKAVSDYEREQPVLERLRFGMLPNGLDPRSAVRAAIALIVGFAARFDRPNRLACELYNLLTHLVEDKDRHVRNALGTWTLWLVVAWHFRQVEPLVRTRVLSSEELMPSVAFGVALACSMRPEETFTILDGWRAAVKADRRRSTPLPRERLLATVALAYGYIECEADRDLLSPSAIGARLRSMLLEEQHPYVRYYTFRAIEMQAVRNFELMSTILQDVISHVSLRDRPAAVEVFVGTYLHQRQRLPNAETRLEIDDVSYGIWLDSPRPLTEVEASLYSWMMDTSRPIAQQLAIDIFEALGETTLEREEKSRHQQSSGAISGQIPPQPESDEPPTLTHLSPLGKMAVFLATSGKPGVREVLQPLVAEMVAVRGRSAALRTRKLTMETLSAALRNSDRVRVLIERWASVTNEATQAMARHLQRALEIYNLRWLIVSGALIAALILGWGTRELYQRVTSPAERETAAIIAEPSSSPSQEVP